MRTLAVGVLFAVLVSGCGGGEDVSEPAEAPAPGGPAMFASEPETETAAEEPTVACGTPPADLVDGIAEGLTVGGGGSLINARSVEVPPGERNDQGWPEMFIAAEITGEGMEGTVGVWATGATGGPIFAINTMAREFSEWGAAAQPGSRADQMMRRLAATPAAAAAEGCVESAE